MISASGWLFKKKFTTMHDNMNVNFIKNTWQGRYNPLIYNNSVHSSNNKCGLMSLSACRRRTGKSLCNVVFTFSVYRVSQEERTKLREGAPYVKLYRYNPKHLYPKLNGYGDNGQRKVWTSCISAYCMSTAV